MMTCLHVGQLSKLVPPSTFSKVFKEECTLCYATQDEEGGIDICLSCFNGGCQGKDSQEHSIRHYRKTSHALVLNLCRKEKPGREADEQPSKVVKLEILPEKEKEYDWICSVRCLACNSEWEPEAEEIASASTTIKAIMTSASAQKKIDVQAWQEEAIPCEHTKKLHQETTIVTRQSDKCVDCELRDNLWMCLTCGSVGCGRKQYDGSGGNGHGANHYELTLHPIAVKLGTITPEGTADVHCYICGEMRIDPALCDHLATFGIDVSGMEKTERTMAELQLEQNLKFDFSMVSEDGNQLKPVSGPGLTGLKNLGNSCYLSSIVQSLFHLSPFKEAYFTQGSEHVSKCQRDSPSCFVCQASKLAYGLWEGKNTVISPWMFKAVTTSGHAEFSTTKQQDASEFMSYFLKVIQRSDPANVNTLVSPFTFNQQQELRCTRCGDCRSQKAKSTMLSLQISDVLASSNDNVTVSDKLLLEQFLERAFASDKVESACTKCGASEREKRLSMTSTPQYLAISLCRYVVRNWVPQKIEMSIKVPFIDLDVSPFLHAPSSTTGSPISMEESPIDEAALAELISMGFTPAKCKMAIKQTGNSGIEPAMNWIFEHMDDKIEDEFVPGPPEDLVKMLIEAGFSREKAQKALRETNNDMERAFDWILSHPDETTASTPIDVVDPSTSTSYDLVAFVSHKGPSVHCGHYIAHVKDTTSGNWIMFNDERVVLADPQPPSMAAEKAYLYIYQRR